MAPVAGPGVPVRLAVVGAGAGGVLHAEAARLAGGVELVAVAARTRRHARRLARQLGVEALAVDDVPGQADVAVVATDPASHAAVAGELLRMGVPCLVERPVGPTVAVASELVRAGARGAENLRFAPLVVHALGRAVAAGEPVTHAELRIWRPRPAWGAWPGIDAVSGLLVDVAAPGVWLAAEALSGGADAGSTVDTVVDTVVARIDGSTSVVVELAAGARRARVEAAWRDVPLVDLQLAGGSWVARAELLPEPLLEVDGTPLDLPGPASSPLVTLGYVSQLTTTLPQLHVGSHEGRLHEIPADRSTEVVKLLCAARRSAASGEPVRTTDVIPTDALIDTA